MKKYLVFIFMFISISLFPFGFSGNCDEAKTLNPKQWQIGGMVIYNQPLFHTITSLESPYFSGILSSYCCTNSTTGQYSLYNNYINIPNAYFSFNYKIGLKSYNEFYFNIAVSTPYLFSCSFFPGAILDLGWKKNLFRTDKINLSYRLGGILCYNGGYSGKLSIKSSLLIGTNNDKFNLNGIFSIHNMLSFPFATDYVATDFFNLENIFEAEINFSVVTKYKLVYSMGFFINYNLIVFLGQYFYQYLPTDVYDPSYHYIYKIDGVDIFYLKKLYGEFNVGLCFMWSYRYSK